MNESSPPSPPEAQQDDTGLSQMPEQPAMQPPQPHAGMEAGAQPDAAANQALQPPEPVSMEDLYTQSMQLLKQSMQACSVDGGDQFQPPPLHVAQPVTQNVFGPGVAPKVDYYGLAAKLYQEQQHLYEEGEQAAQQGHPDPSLAAAENAEPKLAEQDLENMDEHLANIYKMFE